MSNDYDGSKARMERTLGNHPNIGGDDTRSCSDWRCGCQNPEAIEAAKKAGFEAGFAEGQKATYHGDLQPSMNTVVGPEPKPTARLTNLTFTCRLCKQEWFSLEAMTACFRGHVRKKEGSYDHSTH